MPLPWSKKPVDLEPTKGDQASDSNFIEKKLGMSKKGAIFAAGASLFSDGYANASIGPASSILKGYIYTQTFTDNPVNGRLLPAIAFAGIIVGQLTFGWISDKIGRKFGMLLCNTIVFIFSALQAASKGPGDQGTINALLAYRFFVGIGIGGEYPTGSVAAAENTEDPDIDKKSQQKLFVLATNTMIDLAFVLSYFVCLVLLWIFGMHHLQAVWRLTLGLGAVPPLLLFYFRLKMHEPEAYTKNSMRHAKIPYWLIIKRYWLKLAAVSITWVVLYDWITYPFGLYATPITDAADPNGTLYTSIGWGCLINFFYLPGTLVGAFVVDHFGPKYTMIIGLCCQCVIGCILSGTYNLLTQPHRIAGFAILYGLFLSFGELGPGNCLGLLASKAIGPTATRGQLYGIAAAIGKVGAFIGTYTFPQIQASFGGAGTYGGDTGVFWLGSGLALVSATITFFFIPNIKPDAMHDEDILFREYLEANGYDTSQMGLKDTVNEAEAAQIKEEGKVSSSETTQPVI